MQEQDSDRLARTMGERRWGPHTVFPCYCLDRERRAGLDRAWLALGLVEIQYVPLRRPDSISSSLPERHRRTDEANPFT